RCSGRTGTKLFGTYWHLPPKATALIRQAWLPSAGRAVGRGRGNMAPGNGWKYRQADPDDVSVCCRPCDALPLSSAPEPIRLPGLEALMKPFLALGLALGLPLVAACLALGAAPAPPEKLTFVDLQPWANHKLGDDSGRGIPGNNFDSVPKGEQT